MTYTFIADRCSDLPTAVVCRVMKVSKSAYYCWLTNPVSDRDWADAQLTNTIVEVHRTSRRAYGSPRVHADLVLGEGVRCSRKRVERLMRQAGVQGVYRRRGRAAPAATPTSSRPRTWSTGPSTRSAAHLDRPPLQPAGHTDFVGAVAWSPDGTRLASAGDDGMIQLGDGRGVDSSTSVIHTFGGGAYCVTGMDGHLQSCSGPVWRWLRWRCRNSQAEETLLPAEYYGPLPAHVTPT